MTGTTQSWKAVLSRVSGFTAGFEMVCQGLGGSEGLKSGSDCLMVSWLWEDMVEVPGVGKGPS